MSIFLQSASITDFRSIRGTVEIPLDAPVVLIHGQNGSGKTSLLSALEMAATGNVASLRRTDANYLKHLTHRGAETAKITLRMNGRPEVAEWSLAEEMVSGTPLLDTRDSRFFSERCYLAQSTLGRLIEIYEKADQRSNEVPLVQFVREVLRLERLDALIDGLQPVKNIASLRSLVEEYRTAEAHRNALKGDLETKKLRLETLVGERNALLQAGRIEMQRLLEAGEPAPNGMDDAAAAPLFDGVLDEKRLMTAASDKRQIQLLINEWQAVSGAVLAEEERARILQDEREAVSSLEQWRGTEGSQLNDVFKRANSLGLLMVGSPSFGEVELEALTFVIKAQIEFRNKRLSDQNDGTRTVAVLESEIEAVIGRVRCIEEAIAAIVGDPEGLVDTLAKLLPHIHSNDCPVCNRDFTEISDIPLIKHVVAHLEELRDRAETLKTLVKQRTEEKACAAELGRQRSDLQASLMKAEQISQVSAELEGFTTLLTDLEGMVPTIAEGERRREVLRLAERATGKVTEQDRRTEALRDAVRDLAERHALPDYAADRSIPDALELLNRQILQEEDRLLSRQQARKAAFEARKDLLDNQAVSDALKEDITATSQRCDALTEMINAFSLRREAAKMLLAGAVNVRATVIRRVFNDRLNAVWRDLFSRVVPDEPFVPAFVIPETGGVTVGVNIETVHRSGAAAGRPSLMLSAGNLNTAALTLFLALHLSMEKRLPLIILDDPVQSMDGMHIAQFAALLRSMKAEGRQILVAVHERSLFDYLALELGPACDGERLITIELSRSFDGQTHAHCRTHFWEKDRAVA